MKLSVRTRLCLVLVSSHVFVALVAVAICWYEGRRAVLDEVRNQAAAIATLGASLIDGDLHESIKTAEDEKGEAYSNIVSILRRIRDSANEVGCEIGYVYTLRNSAIKPGVIEYVVDAEENHEDFSPVGQVMRSDTAEPMRLDVLQVDEEFSKDDYGEWLSATAPIHDKTGAVVAGLGVDISATAVNRTLSKMTMIGLIVAAVACGLGIVFGYAIARRYTRPLLDLQNTVASIQRGELDTRSKIKTIDEFGMVADAVNAMATGLQEREAIKAAFARYVSQDVLQAILTSREPPKLTGQRKHITVLFSDIRGFTTLSENMRAEDVLDILNEYFSRMIDIIHRHHGTLDKLIGDGIMAVFGAPMDDPHQEEHAVNAAIEMLKVLEELCREWQLAGKQPLQIGIGINSGHAVVGNVGSPTRMEYTAIGDTVNLASRLEECTKDFGHPICMSEYTYAAVKGIFQVSRMGALNVRGRSDPINVYALNGSERSPAASKAEKSQDDDAVR